MLRCAGDGLDQPGCGRLEAGQVIAATEWRRGRQSQDQPPPSLAQLREWARELQAERLSAGKTPSQLLARIAAGATRGQRATWGSPLTTDEASSG